MPDDSIIINSPRDIAPYIDHTCLSAGTTKEDVEKACETAKRHGFRGVVVNPIYVRQAVAALGSDGPIPITVIGFPLGATSADIKVAETKKAVDHGAREVDMVIQIGCLKSGLYAQVEKEIERIVKAAGNRGVKVILETCLLTRQEKVLACKMALSAGATYVKTSTGFAGGGATAEDVRLLRATVGPGFGVKASGGIRTYSDAVAMIKAGADRIGASAGQDLIKEMAY